MSWTPCTQRSQLEKQINYWSVTGALKFRYESMRL